MKRLSEAGNPLQHNHMVETDAHYAPLTITLAIKLKRGQTYDEKRGSTAESVACCHPDSHRCDTCRGLDLVVFMKWLLKNRETVLPVLGAVALALLLAVLVRMDILTTSKLAANKDALSSLSSSVSMIILMIGGVFSYYRFFRGRTFFARADIDIKVTIIDTNTDNVIHFVVVEIKNIGTLPIWNPTPVVDVTTVGTDSHNIKRWDNWVEGTVNSKKEVFTVVDSGEDASFFNEHVVPKDAWAVGYVAYVTAESGETWKKAIMVQNVPEREIVKSSNE